MPKAWFFGKSFITRKTVLEVKELGKVFGKHILEIFKK